MSREVLQKIQRHLERGQVGEAQVVLHEALGDFAEPVSAAETVLGPLRAMLSLPALPGNPVSQCDGGE